MTNIPFTIVDNFFDNPNEIREWGMSLPFNPPQDHYPGIRTSRISDIHFPFYNFVNYKVNNLFFSSKNNTEIHSDMYFQLVDNFEGTGWIHQDHEIYTFIIYLSPDNDINCGTSFYELKPPIINPYLDIENKRFNHHKTGKISTETQKLKQEIYSNTYNKILDIKDKYNRLIVFPSESLHAANYFSNGLSSRLTLIGFVKKIYTGDLYPINRSKKVTLY